MPILLINDDKPTTWEPDPDPHGFIRYDSLTQFPTLPTLGDTEKRTSAAKNVIVSNKDIFKPHEPANTNYVDKDTHVTQDQTVADICDNILLAALIAIYDSDNISNDISDSHTTSQDDVFYTEDNNTSDHTDQNGRMMNSKNRSEVGSEEFLDLSIQAEALTSRTSQPRNDDLLTLKQRRWLKPINFQRTLILLKDLRLLIQINKLR